MRSRRLAFTLLLFSVASTIGAATASDTVATERTYTRFRFERGLLAGFGIEVDAPFGRFEFESVSPSGFVVDASGGDFEGIIGGSLKHVDGFTLRFRDHAVSMAGFEVRPGRSPLTLDLMSSDGRRRFIGDEMHFYYDPDRRHVRLDNVDLQISPELAAEIGKPDLAGVAIGRLEIEATTTPGATTSPDGGVDCTPAVWTGNLDVELDNIPVVQQTERSSGRVVISPSARVRNVGTADVPWRRKFEGSFPPYNNDQHPYLVYAFYRIAPIAGVAGGTAIEMLAQSALKHALYATNQDCWCNGGHILFAATGAGDHDTTICGDVYGAVGNDDPTVLGPRDELEAHTGVWVSTGSFFDQDSDGVCDWDTEGSPDCDYDLYFFDGFDRRLDVLETDLSTASATYYMDAWYIARNDVNIFNSMGWRRVVPTFSSPNWTFPFPAATTLTKGSILDVWVSRTSPPAGASHERIDTGVGELSLAVKTTSLGGGDYHYEYALANHDFDGKVQNVRIPFPPGAAISNAVFRDLDDTAANNWGVTIGADAITFQAPANVNATSLDYGTLFSFGFDADVAPAAGSVDLGALEVTPSLHIDVPAQTPGGAADGAIFSDGLESGNLSHWIVGSG